MANKNQEYQDKARKIVVDYFNSHVDKTNNINIGTEDTYVVWFCKTVDNWKALVSTDIPDGLYYEVTYDGHRMKTYVDVYKKWEHYEI